MNAIYQILSSCSEIVAAVAFVAIVRKWRMNKQSISIISLSATGQEQVNCAGYQRGMQLLEELLTIEGIRVRSGTQLVSQASRAGLICSGNMLRIGEVSAIGDKVKVLESCSDAVCRRIFTTNRISGVLLAKWIDKNIEVV